MSTTELLLRAAIGPATDLSQAWVEAGRPNDFRSFRLGFDCAVKKMAACSRPAGVALDEALAELKKAHRIIYLQRMQMSTPARTIYARNAHHAGLIEDDETRETERAALLARAGVPS